MSERRKNWRADIGRAAQQRNRKKMALLVKLDETRREIARCGTDFARYDELKARQRQIAASLATL